MRRKNNSWLSPSSKSILSSRKLLKEYTYSVRSSRILKVKYNHVFIFLGRLAGFLGLWVIFVCSVGWFGLVLFLSTLLSLPFLPLIIFLSHLLCPGDVVDLETLWRTCMEPFAFQHVHTECFRLCLPWWEGTLFRWSGKGVCVVSYDGNKTAICTLSTNWGAF